jgi:hypothetical protein
MNISQRKIGSGGLIFSHVIYLADSAGMPVLRCFLTLGNQSLPMFFKVEFQNLIPDAFV